LRFFEVNPHDESPTALDTVSLFWEPTIVQNFQNADTKFLATPTDLENDFTRGEESVAQFNVRTQSLSNTGKTSELQRYLLGALEDTKAGHYSIMYVS
jgi:RNA-dependent RNA polymerase